jgi:hypothetical protein
MCASFGAFTPEMSANVLSRCLPATPSRIFRHDAPADFNFCASAAQMGFRAYAGKAGLLGKAENAGNPTQAAPRRSGFPA